MQWPPFMHGNVPHVMLGVCSDMQQWVRVIDCVQAGPTVFRYLEANDNAIQHEPCLMALHQVYHVALIRQNELYDRHMSTEILQTA